VAIFGVSHIRRFVPRCHRISDVKSLSLKRAP
jgi:hypothetical protein